MVPTQPRPQPVALRLKQADRMPAELARGWTALSFPTCPTAVARGRLRCCGNAGCHTEPQAALWWHRGQSEAKLDLLPVELWLLMHRPWDKIMQDVVLYQSILLAVSEGLLIPEARNKMLEWWRMQHCGHGCHKPDIENRRKIGHDDCAIDYISLPKDFIQPASLHCSVELHGGQLQNVGTSV